MHELNLHLISDSAGETLGTISRSVMSQFDGVKLNTFSWFLTRTEEQIQKAIDSIKINKGIVLYTIIDDKLAKILHDECEKLNVKCLSAINHIIQAFAEYLQIEINHIVGRQHVISAEYFEKIEAINFTLTHDDGNSPENMEKADIIIIGPSRTSKSPTSVYLAYKGYKVMNIPYVSEDLMPSKLFEIKNKLIVGLIIDPDRLMLIRKNRLSSLEITQETDYVDVESIKNEMISFRKFATKLKCPLINVTQKSVEETSVHILNLLNARKETK